MSRVGKATITVPSGVSIDLSASAIAVKGAKASLTQALSDLVAVKHEGSEILVTPANDTKRSAMMWGTTRNLIANMVKGVSEGFTVELEIQGVGYRAAIQGSNLQLNLGFSHDVIMPVPEGVSVACPKPTSIVIQGANKQVIGQFAAKVRSHRPPEPYKGKGIRYKGEIVLQKEGKKK